MTDPRRRPRRHRKQPVDLARLARIMELQAGIAQRVAYIRERFPHARTWAHSFGATTWLKPR